ncbi:MAG: DUF1501 domain-containing protein [Phycisphaerales bacterium]|nr:DUF1501 domain-containing protein [Phycisphaerales bacterium]
MPDDMIHTRRQFLKGGLTLISAGATVPLFLDRTAWAISGDPNDAPLVKHRPGGANGRILVVLQLAGGNDGLNTIVPFENDLYYKARPRIGIAKKDVLRLNDQIGLNPGATGLKSLFDEGLLSVVQGVGYPNPNRSHFVATDIWSTGDPTEATHNGWIGRYFDCTCSGRERPDPKRGISITSEVPLAMQGEKFSPVSFSTPDELTWRGPGARGRGRKAFEDLNRPHGAGNSDEGAPQDEASALAYLERMAMDARASAEEIQKAAGSGKAKREGRRRRGRNALEGDLEMVRRMIRAGLETSVYYVSMGGFDTHANQLGSHNNLIKQFSDAVKAFTDGLRSDGLLDRVMLMTFSEFGRRVAENGSGGTDHGAAAPLFVIGGGVKAGVHGAHPSLETKDLDRGDLKWGTDFRSVYATVLDGWLKTDSKRILNGSFKPLPLLKA